MIGLDLLQCLQAGETIFFLMIGGVFFSLFMNVKAICWAFFCGSVFKRGNNSVVLWPGNAKNVQNTLLLIGGI